MQKSVRRETFVSTEEIAGAGERFGGQNPGLRGSLADQPRLAGLSRHARTVRSAPKAGEGLRPPPHSRSDPGYGREPVGNGHAAAGFSAILAPAAAADGALAGAAIAVRACG